MTMKPYHEITDDEQDNGIYKTRFDDYDSDVIIAEHYCVNNRCTCTEVFLTFYSEQKNKVPKPLMSVRLNYSDWNVVDTDLKSPEATEAQLAEKFKDNINDEFKTQITNHAFKAKAYAERTNALNAAYIRSGTSVGYTELFDEENNDVFTINQGTHHILVDDAYCMNPKCDCGEALLSFMDIHPYTKSERRRFALRYHLKKGRYEVLDQNCGREELVELADLFLKNREAAVLLKQRYDRMKKEGQRIISEEHQAKMTDEHANLNTVGRNDPCPCGSGKKYKKCCDQT